MAGFGLFGSLPAELRLKIWGFALEHEEPQPRRRRHMTALLVFSIGGECGEHRLPVVSAVSRESRKEFLRLYVRFLDPQVPAHRFLQSHGYMNPSMVLGVHVSYEASIGHSVASAEQEQYTLGYMMDVPVLRRAAQEQIRTVRLHDVDFVARVKGSIQVKDSSVSPSFIETVLDQDPLCVARLPPLRLPNLSAIQIVSLSIPQADLETLFGLRFRTHYDFRFRYSQSSRRVYIALASFRWLSPPIGCRMLQVGFSRPWPRVFVQIEILAEDPDTLPFDGWIPLEDRHLAECFIWRLSVQYAALRLG
ncbi:hypothetical protein CGRA01v4_08926 [Colletotrichum graminicola]|uniref:2EXR domain-containing protein n=1 Tax=Colletotrichum graminicola (strain M1.001 / M2 / FGSC 10212) TaxID=645133 RepID=E3Q7G6_COLGM|nr:uncharacterized protein GLRG_02624 [Colletotrichum graminicola M1.001]EFQ26804.1 hypothetical protein GLRG_02624 [Colletotrichum graminicola M1.001]WDK17643.1 hypothetical protein CGRA01v4_08926 [Colletotrichum graminicola]